MANGLTANMQAQVDSVDTFGDYVTPATDKLRVQALIDLLSPGATQTHRGLMDQMSPSAQIQLLKELQTLYTNVT